MVSFAASFAASCGARDRRLPAPGTAEIARPPATSGYAASRRSFLGRVLAAPSLSARTFVTRTSERFPGPVASANASAGDAERVELRKNLEALMARQNLTSEETAVAMDAFLSGRADPHQTAAFLVLLRAKGETAAELAGMARAMKAKSVRVSCKSKVLDIVGTGGDGASTVNISTAASVLCAAAGARIAKHGSRSVSSKCGSADVLEALGVNVELGPEAVARCVDECGVAFMFAPFFHPAMKAVSPIRTALKVRTAFNLLGPLTNPAGATFKVIGVASPELVDLIAATAHELSDFERVWVVHSCGTDEFTPMGPSEVVEVTRAGVGPRFTVDPLDYGIPRCSVSDLQAGEGYREDNARALREVFSGAQGPIADAIVLNAGVGLHVAGVASTLKEGIELARETQLSGRPVETLEKWASLTQTLARSS
eukprot:tig00021589_g22715.t1